MKIEVKLPKLGESLTEGTVLKWWKKIGEPVKKDETLLEISTDKVDSEIPSPADGTLAEILAEENETVEVDAVLGRIETEAGAALQEKEPDIPSAQEKVKAPGSQKSVEEESIKQRSISMGKLVDVKMPQLGESLTEGTVLKWWKKAGESVKKDETLLEVSTDKVDSEIPSPVNGVVSEIVAQENETVEVDQVLARIETAEGAETKPAPEKRAAPDPSKPGETATAGVEQQPPKRIARKRGGRFYSPLVRNIARKEGISMEELEQISGSGTGGRVTKKDILNYLELGKPEREKEAEKKAPTVALEEAAAAPTSEPAYEKDRVNIVDMDPVRKRIAVHMRKSLDTSAHVYSVSECDMSRIMNLMHRMRPSFQHHEGFKLTITPFILHSVTKTLRDFPRVNSSLEGQRIIEKKDINLGIAVAAEKGLIVPVLKNAEDKSFGGLAREAHDLIRKTRENKLTVEDVQGSTFSITNYGIFGNIIGLPIINQPNVAILGIGAVKKRPVVIESADGDSIGIRSMAYISMSYDHRVVDGELGGKFMQRLVNYLENMSEEQL